MLIVSCAQQIGDVGLTIRDFPDLDTKLLVTDLRR